MILQIGLKISKNVLQYKLKKQQFINISKFTSIGVGLSYLFLLYEIVWYGSNNYFMGMNLPVPQLALILTVFFATNLFSFYLIWTNKLAGYFILPATLFIQTILLTDTWFMHWPCHFCPVLQ